MREPQFAAQQLGLGALAGARRADQQEDASPIGRRRAVARIGHRMKPS